MIRIKLKEPRRQLEEVNIDKDPKRRGVSWWNKVALQLAAATQLDPREAAETIDWLAGLILNESVGSLLTENVEEVARKLHLKFPDKFKWDVLAGKIGEFSTSPIEAGQLLTWVAKQLLDDNAEVEYHGEMTKEMQLLEAVRLFAQNKQFLKNKDINSYKNQPQVLAAVKEGMNSPAALRAREKKKAEEEKSVDPNADPQLSNNSDRQYIYNGKTLKVILLKSEEGSCKYGAGTKWCTAATNGNLFNSYSHVSHLFVIIGGDNRKIQLALNRESGIVTDSMDEQDRHIGYPAALKVFGPELNLGLAAIRKKFKWVTMLPFEREQRSQEEITRGYQIGEGFTQKINDLADFDDISSYGVNQVWTDFYLPQTEINAIIFTNIREHNGNGDVFTRLSENDLYGEINEETPLFATGVANLKYRDAAFSGLVRHHVGLTTKIPQVRLEVLLPELQLERIGIYPKLHIDERKEKTLEIIESRLQDYLGTELLVRNGSVVLSGFEPNIMTAEGDILSATIGTADRLVAQLREKFIVHKKVLDEAVTDFNQNLNNLVERINGGEFAIDANEGMWLKQLIRERMVSPPRPGDIRQEILPGIFRNFFGPNYIEMKHSGRHRDPKINTELSNLAYLIGRFIYYSYRLDDSDMEPGSLTIYKFLETLDEYGEKFRQLLETPAVPSQIRENFFGRFSAEEIRKVLQG